MRDDSRDGLSMPACVAVDREDAIMSPSANGMSGTSSSVKRSVRFDQQLQLSFGGENGGSQARDQLSQHDHQCGENMIVSMSTQHRAIMHHPFLPIVVPPANGSANNASSNVDQQRIAQISDRLTKRIDQVIILLP